MENSSQKQSRVALELQLVKELERMRDKLTELSLVMHDLKFQVDVPQRAEAQDIAANCIMRCSRRLNFDPPGVPTQY